MTIDEQKVDWLADRFYKSDYDIGKLMEDIFTSDWFYDEKNIGCKIKSPVELTGRYTKNAANEIRK